VGLGIFIYSKCWVEAWWRQAETKQKNCEQSGCLLCSRVRGPVNLAGPLEILAKVWLHKNLEKGDQKEWSCTLQVGLVANPLLGTMEGLPPSLLHSFRFSSHQPPNNPQDYYVPARNKFKSRQMAPPQVIDDIVIWEIWVMSVWFTQVGWSLTLAIFLMTTLMQITKQQIFFCTLDKW
jgi:hypothetical protein